MSKVLWFAAYPKTGSTWLRSILHQLTAPKQKSTEAIPSFSNEFPEAAPEHRILGTEAKIVRTHTNPDHPAFQKMQAERSDEVVGLLTIHRHPLDVLLSQLNYSRIIDRPKNFVGREIKTVEQVVADGEIDRYIDAFLAAGGCPEHVRRCHGYVDFYSRWAEVAPAAPRLNLRYEDMVADPIGGIESIQAFLGLTPVDSDRIMRRVEKHTAADGQFFWRKKAYNYKEMIPEASIKRFEEGFADGLRELGYSSTGIGMAAQPS